MKAQARKGIRLESDPLTLDRLGYSLVQTLPILRFFPCTLVTTNAR